MHGNGKLYGSSVMGVFLICFVRNIFQISFYHLLYDKKVETQLLLSDQYMERGSQRKDLSSRTLKVGVPWVLEHAK